jgi:hypothetical protein
MKVMRWGIILGALVATACSSGSDLPPVAAELGDANADVDAGPAALEDAHQDVEPDAVADAGRDAPGDAAVDAPWDAPGDAARADAGPTDSGPGPQPTPDAEVEASAPPTVVTCATTTGSYSTGTGVLVTPIGEAPDSGAKVYKYPITPDDGNGSAYWGGSIRYESVATSAYVTVYPTADKNIAPCVSGSSCIVSFQIGGSVSGHCP